MRQIHSEHNELMRSVIEGFATRFGPDGRLVYAGGPKGQGTYVDQIVMGKLGVCLQANREMPDAVLYVAERNLLLLIECVTGRGCINVRRKAYLGKLFEGSKAGLVFVSV